MNFGTACVVASSPRSSASVPLYTTPLMHCEQQRAFLPFNTITYIPHLASLEPGLQYDSLGFVGLTGGSFSVKGAGFVTCWSGGQAHAL